MYLILLMKLAASAWTDDRSGLPARKAKRTIDRGRSLQSLALVDGDHPATIDFWEASFRPGLATPARQKVGLQEIRRICRSGHCGRVVRGAMGKVVVKATIFVSAVVGSTASLFMMSWFGLALLGFSHSGF
jgi:hypothetical protein